MGSGGRAGRRQEASIRLHAGQVRPNSRYVVAPKIRATHRCCSFLPSRPASDEPITVQQTLHESCTGFRARWRSSAAQMDHVEIAGSLSPQSFDFVTAADHKSSTPCVLLAILFSALFELAHSIRSRCYTKAIASEKESNASDQTAVASSKNVTSSASAVSDHTAANPSNSSLTAKQQLRTW